MSGQIYLSFFEENVATFLRIERSISVRRKHSSGLVIQLEESEKQSPLLLTCGHAIPLETKFPLELRARNGATLSLEVHSDSVFLDLAQDPEAVVIQLDHQLLQGFVKAVHVSSALRVAGFGPKSQAKVTTITTTQSTTTVISTSTSQGLACQSSSSTSSTVLAVQGERLPDASSTAAATNLEFPVLSAREFLLPFVGRRVVALSLFEGDLRSSPGYLNSVGPDHNFHSTSSPVRCWLTSCLGVVGQGRDEAGDGEESGSWVQSCSGVKRCIRGLASYPSYPGLSGGPVVSADGQLLGVHVGTRTVGARHVVFCPLVGVRGALEANKTLSGVLSQASLLRQDAWWKTKAKKALMLLGLILSLFGWFVGFMWRHSDSQVH